MWFMKFLGAGSDWYQFSWIQTSTTTFAINTDRLWSSWTSLLVFGSTDICVWCHFFFILKLSWNFEIHFEISFTFREDDINGTVVYYSTLPQLYEVINLLAVDDFEKHLATAIFDRLHEISSQMRITMELTNERNQTKTDPYLVAENCKFLKYLCKMLILDNSLFFDNCSNFLITFLVWSASLAIRIKPFREGTTKNYRF